MKSRKFLPFNSELSSQIFRPLINLHYDHFFIFTSNEIFCHLLKMLKIPWILFCFENWDVSNRRALGCARARPKVSVANSADFSENGRFSTLVADEIFTKICKDFWPNNHKNGRFLPFNKKLQKMTDFCTNCASFGRFCMINFSKFFYFTKKPKKF